MADIQKKLAAALAAVNAYLQEEEAATNQVLATALVQDPQHQHRQWAQSGRQEMMTLRRLIQLRAFSGGR